MTTTTRRYLLACMAVCAAAAATAQDTIDWGEIEPGTTYEYKALTPVEGTYTAKTTGNIRCYITGDIVNPYSDAEHQNGIDPSQSYYGPNGEKVRLFQVTQGQTVYFYNKFPLSNGTFRLEDTKEKILLSKATPSPDNGTLSMSTNYRLTVMFNIPVKISKCKIEANGTSAEIPVSIYESTVEVNWFNTVMDWYRSGKIKEGDTMTVTLTGIRDDNDSSNRPDFGDGLGKLVLNYTMADIPAELTRETNTPGSGVTDFYTYYLPEGNDGVVELFFSKDLSTEWTPEATIQYGDVENMDFGLYIEHPPVKVEGQSVKVDLRGVTRFPEEMIPGLAPLSNISLTVSRIKSADGQYVLTGSLSNPYTFGYSYNLKSVTYSIAADWLPLPGSEIKSGDSMEIWVLNGNKIQFDSVDFAFTANGEATVAKVAYSELEATNDTTYEDAMIYTLAVPEIAPDADSEVTVSFGNLQCADGLDHSSDILVRYKATPSGVDETETEKADMYWHDLAGNRHTRPGKGVMIHNGKKTIITH